jgi:hypothetical protein
VLYGIAEKERTLCHFVDCVNCNDARVRHIAIIALGKMIIYKRPMVIYESLSDMNADNFVSVTSDINPLKSSVFMVRMLVLYLPSTYGVQRISNNTSCNLTLVWKVVTCINAWLSCNEVSLMLHNLSSFFLSKMDALFAKRAKQELVLNESRLLRRTICLSQFDLMAYLFNLKSLSTILSPTEASHVQYDYNGNNINNKLFLLIMLLILFAYFLVVKLCAQL